MSVIDDVVIEWRGAVTGDEVELRHVAAFGGGRTPGDGGDWTAGLGRYSLGWCAARREDELVGFSNVLTDGHTHAWLQDVIVHPTHQRSGVGRAMVDLAATEAGAAGCEWLHVDFADDSADFYFRTCGFEPTQAGLRHLRRRTTCVRHNSYGEAGPVR